MVEQILALAGAQKRWPAMSHQKLAPSEVLYEAVAATAQEAQNAYCAVHVELPPGLPPIVGDATALRRVFENLISNAAKHGGQGGWIGISGASHEDTVPPVVEIRIADRGRGIPPDEQAEIFRPFFRGSSAQTKQVRGSGLGLSLVREIVEAHGGRVYVDSENGKGTTFTVRLPAVSTTEAQ
jgi:signal transduction histidine kinase